MMDGEGTRMQYLSPAFEGIWGFPREQAYTDLKKLKDFIHPRGQVVSRGDFQEAIVRRTN